MNIPQQPMAQPLTQQFLPVLTPNMLTPNLLTPNMQITNPFQLVSLDGPRCSTPTPSLSMQPSFYPMPTPPPARQTTPPRRSAPTPPVCVTQSMSAITESTPETFDKRNAE